MYHNPGQSKHVNRESSLVLKGWNNERRALVSVHDVGQKISKIVHTVLVMNKYNVEHYKVKVRMNGNSIWGWFTFHDDPYPANTLTQ